MARALRSLRVIPRAPAQLTFLLIFTLHAETLQRLADMHWRTVSNTAKGMPAHWLTPCSFSPQGSKLYMCSTCVTLHCLESSISLCFSGRRAGLLEWTALHYNSTQMLPLEVWRQNSSKSLKCSVSMSLLQQFSVVGPLILLVIHLSSLSKALCLHYPRSNATANSLFHISVRHTSSCKPAAEMSTCGLKWCCTDMNHLYINK